MITREIIDYIKSEMKRGVSKEVIISNLVSGGSWKMPDVEEALATIDREKNMFNIPQSPINNSTVVMQTSNVAQVASLPGFNTLLKESWLIFKKRFWIFLGILIIPLICNIVSNLLLKSTFTSLAFKIFFFIVNFALNIWGVASLISAISSEEKIGIIESAEKGLNKFFPYLWAIILMMFFVFGASILLFIPGIIFFIWFVFFDFILVSENITGMKALLKSREYIRGKFWSVFWKIICPFLLILLIILVLVVIWGLLTIISRTFPGFSLGVFGLVFPILLTVIAGIFVLFVAFMYKIYLFTIYKNLKSIKGDFVFTTSGKKKTWIIVVASFGIVLWILSTVVLASLSVARKKAEMQGSYNSTQEVTNNVNNLNEGFPRMTDSNTNAKLDSFAMCLKDSGAKFYGTEASWCPQCQEQKGLFGSSAKYLPFIECSVLGENAPAQICIDKEIIGYPTWTFKDLSRLQGPTSLKILSQKTGCKLP